ncbi:MAG: hypothetical protein BMS9Abin07_2388 [Acidimicrobiia bacterium]|nr:MAG: hypothetical protein BMS9Abin07_2388 [Acidimicrobiia bacterium]
MPFAVSDAPISIRAEILEAFRNEWAFLSAPGTWWSGAERVAIAAEARRAMSGEPHGADLPDPVVRVVRAVAADSPLITAEWVGNLEDEGIALPAYVEIIGIVARLSAVDLFHIALGMALEVLPEPQPGEASRTPPPSDVAAGRSFVPMRRPAGVTHSTSLVPAETAAWLALSDVLYMTLEEMEEPDFRRAMHRTQIELVAARTSQVNECFY